MGKTQLALTTIVANVQLKFFFILLSLYFYMLFLFSINHVCVYDILVKEKRERECVTRIRKSICCNKKMTVE